MSSIRQQQRQTLLAERAAMTKKQRELATQQILRHLEMMLLKMTPQVLALYWPIKNEISCHAIMPNLLKKGWQLCLPVINNETKKLQFSRWTPETTMVAGYWNIPIPTINDWLNPDMYLIPLVGFDLNNYRLGYGGGFYDRTLGDINKPATFIGIGLESARLTTIDPHEFDIPMDIIITESGLIHSNGRS